MNDLFHGEDVLEVELPDLRLKEKPLFWERDFHWSDWKGFKCLPKTLYKLFHKPHEEADAVSRKASVLRLTLWACLLLLILMEIMQVLHHPEHWEAPIMMVSSSLLICAALILLRRGHITLVSWIVVSFGWLIFSVDLFLIAGIRGTSVIGQIMIMVLAGFLFGGKSVMVLALLTAGTNYLVLLTEINGWIENPLPLGANTSRWLTQTGYILISAIFIWLTDRRIHQALGVARENAEQYRALFDRTSDAIFILNETFEIISANQQAAALLGYPLEELIGEAVTAIIPPEHLAQHRMRLAQILEQVKHPVFEGALLAKDGQEIPVEMNVARVDDAQGRFQHMQNIVRDISARKQLEAQLHRQAFYDSLTSLPNRALFEDRLTQAVARAKRSHSRLAVLFLDFDRFKQVNDRYGHQAGDQTLQKLAERLLAGVRASDTVARLGGDEFVILVENLTSAEVAQQIAAKLYADVSRPIYLDQLTISLTVSIGISQYLPSDFSPADLIRQADQAMYEAKLNPEKNIVFFSQEKVSAT